MTEIFKPTIPETGPRPLTDDQIALNLERLKMGRIIPPRSGSMSSSNMGIFSVGLKAATRKGHFFSEQYWSGKLLSFSDRPHILKIDENGILKVYETEGEKLITAQNEPKTSIQPKDIRKLSQSGIKYCKVHPSGFVFEINRRDFDLKSQNLFSLEEIEEMLLKTQKNGPPDSMYQACKGFAKIDPHLAGRDVLLIPFENQDIISYIEGTKKDTTGDTTKHASEVSRRYFRKEEAVILDLEKQKLVPRVFYTLDPEK